MKQLAPDCMGSKGPESGLAGSSRLPPVKVGSDRKEPWSLQGGASLEGDQPSQAPAGSLPCSAGSHGAGLVVLQVASPYFLSGGSRSPSGPRSAWAMFTPSSRRALSAHD